MKTLEGHKVNPANDRLFVAAVGTVSPAGAYHAYLVTGADLNRNTALPALWQNGIAPEKDSGMAILFQNGPIHEVGVNGITHEALIAILIDRLEGFQAGPYAHPANAAALAGLRAAQEALHGRTRERMDRGVEGTHTV